VREGRILINGNRTYAGKPLSSGDVVEYLPDECPEPPVETTVNVLYEDDELVVVDKPPNLPCHPSGRYFENTLLHFMKGRWGMPYLSIVNRLDRETSGLVLMAKTRQAARQCYRQMSARLVHKRYWAVVEGFFPREKVEARGYLIKDDRSVVNKKLRFHGGLGSEGRPEGSMACATILRGVRRKDGLTLVEAVPETGRLHQIRATLVSLGYPVVGDKIYGIDDTLFLRFLKAKLTDSDRASLRLPRQAVHAAELHLCHPVTGDLLRFKAAIPPDMARLIG
jgi:23S rRNA pseudouridine955/2504/2580 synthase/23S rRNA pseudouridine1911/1915/1917 synthase